MQRVLDLDLDAFVYGVAHWRDSDASRLDDEDFPAWEKDTLDAFLKHQCLLEAPRPGIAVEHHGELFDAWRRAIDAGALTPPFHVTHIDAHADLGMGDNGYMHLLTELLALPVDQRHAPRVGDGGLGDGNYLAFAIANQWISALDYVVGGRDHETIAAGKMEQPRDLLIYLFENFDLDAGAIRLPLLERQNLSENLVNVGQLRPLDREPAVPFAWEAIETYRAAAPFDLVCLARSPGFTPVAADMLFDTIRRSFIDELDLPA